MSICRRKCQKPKTSYTYLGSLYNTETNRNDPIRFHVDLKDWKARKQTGENLKVVCAEFSFWISKYLFTYSKNQNFAT